MQIAAHAWLWLAGLSIGALSMAYAIVAWLAVGGRGRGESPPPAETPPVTVLKPLCGADPGTYEALRSYCDQAYPQYQIVFGVGEADDPAVAIVARLQREFPGLDLQLVVDGKQHGSNRKVSNLTNMMLFARHDHLVIADSDIRVARGYLAAVASPLLDPNVGIVTCAYRGCAQAGLWSLFGSWFINDWFLPSVRVASLFGFRAFAFGATIAIRRDVLGRIGGFAAIANQLADDYRLGELTRRLGLVTVLSECEVETMVNEPTFGDLVRHELRWLRTIRAVNPVGYAFSFVTFGVPIAAFGCALAQGARPALAMLAITAAARLMLHWQANRPTSPPRHWLLLPLRDTLNLALWSWGFVTDNVHWRRERFRVIPGGSVHRFEDSTP